MTEVHIHESGAGFGVIFVQKKLLRSYRLEVKKALKNVDTIYCVSTLN